MRFPGKCFAISFKSSLLELAPALILNIAVNFLYTSSAVLLRLAPELAAESIAIYTFRGLAVKIACSMLMLYSVGSEPLVTSVSKLEIEFLTLPPARAAHCIICSFVISPALILAFMLLSLLQIFTRLLVSSFVVNCLNVLICSLLLIAGFTFSGSVVQQINSVDWLSLSSPINIASWAAEDIFCTSSSINTFLLTGWETLDSSIICLTSSAPPLLAIEIYLIPGWASESIALQVLHSLQGSPLGWGFSQLIDLASILAIDVLPVPAVPENRYPVGTLFSIIAICKDFTIVSCPTTSANVLGLYFLYSSIYCPI